MQPNCVYVYPFEAMIPELKESLAVLQTVGVRTVILGESDPRPKGAHAVISREEMGNAQISGAALLVEQRLGIPIRHSEEKPTGSIEHARARGFSDEQIAAELRPWRAKGVNAAEQALQEAEAAVKAAQANLVETRARADRPLDDPAG